MSLMAFQINSLTIVDATIYSGAGQRKPQSSASPVTSEFPAQMASNAEKISFHDAIMLQYIELTNQLISNIFVKKWTDIQKRCIY